MKKASMIQFTYAVNNHTTTDTIIISVAMGHQWVMSNAVAIYRINNGNPKNNNIFMMNLTDNAYCKRAVLVEVHKFASAKLMLFFIASNGFKSSMTM